MIFLYIFRGIGIISVLDLIMLHNSLHFLENLFDLWFEIQTDGWKKPGPLLLLSAVPDACSILQCKYSNMVKYNRPNDDDGTENCISYSKIVVNKYKYQHSRDTSIYKYQYIQTTTADAKMLSVNLIFCSIMNTYLAFVQYINKDFPPLTFEIANHKCTFFHASIRNSSNIWTLFWFLKDKF